MVYEPIYVIAGKEESLVNAECSQLLEKLLEPRERATGLFAAEAGQTPISEVLDELRTVPFLTDKRVVLIKRADEFISHNRPLQRRAIGREITGRSRDLATSSPSWGLSGLSR